ncbi:MAG: CvpA family protein [Chloroflexi bacterium]|nr:CvpA family protein [Chloroflexota bacterium]
MLERAGGAADGVGEGGLVSWVDIAVGVMLLWVTAMGFRKGLAAWVVWLGAGAAASWLATRLSPFVMEWARRQPDLPDMLVAPGSYVAALVVAGILVCAGASFLIGAIRGGLRQLGWVYTLDQTLGGALALAFGIVSLAAVTLAVDAVPVEFGVKRDLAASQWNRTVMPRLEPLTPQLTAFSRSLGSATSGLLLPSELPTSPDGLLKLLPPGLAADSGSLTRLLPGPFSAVQTPTSEVGETATLTFPAGIKLDISEPDERRMLELVNQERASAGLRSLTLDPTLREVARAHSRDMFTRGYFAHNDPGGQSPFDRMTAGGANYRAAGENLAYAPNVERAHTGLMNSPGHRANILRPEFGRVGIGAIASDGHGSMYTQNFAD